MPSLTTWQVVIPASTPFDRNSSPSQIHQISFPPLHSGNDLLQVMSKVRLVLSQHQTGRSQNASSSLTTRSAERILSNKQMCLPPKSRYLGCENELSQPRNKKGSTVHFRLSRVLTKTTNRLDYLIIFTSQTRVQISQATKASIDYPVSRSFFTSWPFIATNYQLLRHVATLGTIHVRSANESTKTSRTLIFQQNISDSEGLL
jgi:hypothetical protein